MTEEGFHGACCATKKGRASLAASESIKLAEAGGLYKETMMVNHDAADFSPSQSRWREIDVRPSSRRTKGGV